LPGVAYPGVRDNRSTINTKTGYDDDDDEPHPSEPAPELSETAFVITPDFVFWA